MKRGENKGDGIFQTAKGWGYRLVIKKDGKTITDTTRTKGEDGKPFLTKSEAKKAKAAHLLQLQNLEQETKKKYNITFSDAWQIYLDNESKGKAESTIKKQESVWNNHIKERFSDSEMNETTITEMYSFLCDKYSTGLKYSYVNSFLKIFYLLYGVANRAERIELNKYNRMFVNNETRLLMPSKRADDDDDDNIVIYDSAEINIIAEICKNKDNGDIYLLFLLCYFCGLRLGEACGLMWDDIDYANNTITINKQLQPTENKLFMICKLKTTTAKREIDMPAILREELAERHRLYCKTKDSAEMKNTEKVLDKRKAQASVITGGNFVNRRKNGTLITQNSIKKIVKLIKAEGIENFHFHALRSTHASQLAAANVPPSEVMKRMGHKKFDTTLKFYINSTSDAHQRLLSAINSITTNEKSYLVSINGADYKEMTESQLKEFKSFVKRNPTAQTDIKIIEKSA